ncbi:hypothetical protein J1C67_11885 [Clostridium gasigenes]|uniref:hypothetical protein n=1 Tax=Clostridium gasigenes TaxID=94869 RepID=UPI001438378F|nr:hypothetical protein [Clostridium gasigenes]NKF07286.1 hypothetical protein [Clostridium gasigenes]QSW18263.1 hypothetical protein J1C67_11885 [Clostridium gasigenes]
MKRSKTIILIGAILVGIITGVFVYYLETKGLVTLKFRGIEFIDWIFIITSIAMTIIVIIDYILIKRYKNKFGKLKYILLRQNRKKQVYGLRFLIAIFIFQLIIIILFSDEFKFMYIAPLFLIGNEIIMFSIHNNEKEGINENCIYSWGNAIKWDKVKSYNINENILCLELEKKMFGKIERYKMPFKLDMENKDDIVKLIDMKIN